MIPVCPETEVTRPECSCRSCCEELLTTWAPHLLSAASDGGPPLAEHLAQHDLRFEGPGRR